MTTSRAARAAGRRAGRSPWVLPLAVLLVLAGVFAAGAGLGRTTGPLDWASTAGIAGSGRGEGQAPTVSRPVRLAVPAIGVAAPIMPVGQARDGSIAVPPLERAHETGWYDRGPAPGEPGPAVVVGHVDTRRGPSVFVDLHRLRPGDTVEVTRADGSAVEFRIDSVERFPKDRLPADRVYGDAGPAGLRLITCGGTWVGGRTGYADNVIAFATMTGTRRGDD